ncbi:DUF3857 domain-containing protein [Gramella sp. ASW11-100T]|uniref:DUF3857 domain-containing protein n=1 Tax=Christiangramia sediminis TaxID=2881336 RepID=A0A9X1RZS0_9FLAO|nr:DUF3857 domain-containing protein [Christiangramia sediminis]MCB7482525.1 DUF3857 domain-containing protein [Christiangramia sediminis]
MVDETDNLQTQESYTRAIYKLFNNEAIQDLSSLNFTFDPEYEELIIHYIRILRDGKVLKRLNLNDIQVAQREENLESNLLDGRLTVINQLKDVRKNDVVDYAYTIKGWNPVHQNNFQSSFYLEFQFPVLERNYSILVPQNQSLYYKMQNGAPEPKVNQTNQHIIYTWSISNPNVINYEPNTPAWYAPNKYVEITQFKSWNQVARQYSDLFNVNTSEVASLSNSIPEEIKNSKTEDEYINKAIRFVQDEVRYLGYEGGLNSHMPSKPSKVINRRYGDCKDKAHLLSQILSLREITSFPVLVHNSSANQFNERLPSGVIFNHCIVQIERGDKKYYVDATLSNQGGDYKNIYFPNYHYGLPLKDSQDDLELLPSPEPSIISVTDTFILDSIGGRADLEISSIYRGSQADYKRLEFAESNMDIVKKNYLNFYSSYYPSIKSTSDIQFIDERNKNEIRIIEKYKIDSLWKKSTENENVIFSEFYPMAMSHYFETTKTAEREMPYYLNIHNNMEYNTIVFVPQAWSIEPLEGSFGTDAFEYNYDVKYKNARLDLVHTYKTNKYYLEPHQVNEFIKEQNRAKESLSYFLTYDKAFTGSNDNNFDDNWLSLPVSILIIILSCILLNKIGKNYKVISREKEEWSRKIGGILIFLAILLAFYPLVYFGQAFGGNFLSSPSLWSDLFSSTWESSFLLIFETVASLFLMVFAIYLNVWFYKRRTYVPNLLIIFFSGVLAINFIDAILTNFLIEGSNVFSNPKWIQGLSFQFILAVIFIPYLYFSNRVSETFTRLPKKYREYKIKNEEAFQF